MKIKNFENRRKREALKFPNELKRELKAAIESIEIDSWEKGVNKINQQLRRIIENWRTVLIQENYISQEWKYNLTRANLCIINIRRIQAQMWQRGREMEVLRASLHSLRKEMKRLGRD